MELNKEQLKAIMTKADNDLDKLKDRCHELYEENERLKEDLKGQENLTLSYCKSEQDYKTRCEKAIEYMKKNEFININNYWEVVEFYQDLLNILKGESK